MCKVVYGNFLFHFIVHFVIFVCFFCPHLGNQFKLIPSCFFYSQIPFLCDPTSTRVEEYDTTSMLVILNFAPLKCLVLLAQVVPHQIDPGEVTKLYHNFTKTVLPKNNVYLCLVFFTCYTNFNNISHAWC